MDRKEVKFYIIFYITNNFNINHIKESDKFIKDLSLNEDDFNDIIIMCNFKFNLKVEESYKFSNDTTVKDLIDLIYNKTKEIL